MTLFLFVVVSIVTGHSTVERQIFYHLPVFLDVKRPAKLKVGVMVVVDEFGCRVVVAS
jgi:hypothetical protein